jgi:hypothetical protein
MAGSPLEPSSAERLSNWLLDDAARRGEIPTPSASACPNMAEDARTQSLLAETEWKGLFNLHVERTGRPANPVCDLDSLLGIKPVMPYGIGWSDAPCLLRVS